MRNAVSNLCACLAVGFVWLFNQTGYAQSQVLFFDSPNVPPRDGLYAALRIQLAGVARVSRFGTLADTAITDKMTTVVASVKDRKAILAVWAEGPNKLSDGSSELVLYLVGERSGRAIVELVRIPAGEGPDVDRSLALKVREVVDSLLESRRGHLLAKPVHRTSKDRERVDQAARVGSVFGAGVIAATQSGTRFGLWGAALDGGAWLRLSNFRIAGEVTLHLLDQIEIENEYGRVFIDEISPGIAMRALVDYLPFSIGMLFGLQIRTVNATGVTSSGAVGDDQTVIPCLDTALDAQIEFYKTLALRIDLGVQLALQPKRYTINDRKAADLGRYRPFAQLGFVFWQ